MARIAIIQADKCNPVKCSWLCQKLCPINRTGEECIKQDKKAAIDEKLCNGCGICQARCPFQAISIINLPETLKESPIHRYGKNQFELFRLPLIKKNSVVGIIGRNGIGKSTSLQILSGNIKPNLGNYKTPPSDKEITEKYSKIYLGEYFKALFSKKLKISYKPQRIELIPKIYKGKVIELIKKIDEKNIGEKLLKELDLENIKNNDISNLSGGELQRLAIIASLIRKADVIYLDEPASFLDVTHRIKVAKLIRSLAKDSTIIVVEHDLATLDYISDEIQIIYGKPACYGVISQSQSVRRGINEYLDGFITSDNVRFRDYKIKFSESAIRKEYSQQILYEFPEFEKSFQNFHLKVNSGKLHKGEVLAVVGANALGKTTFLKILAGLEIPDNKKIEKIKIAYKPQYIESIKGTVLEHLQKIAGPDMSSGWYKTNILEKLNINHILNNELSTLSGGELQKFYIAATLSNREATLFAFDEPSAFIDVEDRLKTAEVIKEFTLKKGKSSIVVDHDVQFIDHLADSMLVFEGIPGKKASVYGPCEKREGMNRVLKMLDITYRRDKVSGRPRINKPGSQLDREQRSKGEYYYTD